jgi:hypothetical protein
MDLSPSHIDAIIDGESWRIVAQKLATNHGLDPKELARLRDDALSTVNSIPWIAALKSNPVVSPAGIAALQAHLSKVVLWLAVS